MQLPQDGKQYVEGIEKVTWEGRLFVAHSEGACSSAKRFSLGHSI